MVRAANSKLIWIDTETTGTDPEKSSIIQIGCIVEIGTKIESFSFSMQPFPEDIVNAEASAKHGFTEKQLASFQTQKNGYCAIRKMLNQFVDPYDTRDKFIVAGYNVKFDTDMLRSCFNRNDDKYYGSWFWWPSIDVVSEVAKYMLKYSVYLPKFRLETVCAYFGINLSSAHDALSDIIATRKLYYLLTEMKEKAND